MGWASTSCTTRLYFGPIFSLSSPILLMIRQGQSIIIRPHSIDHVCLIKRNVKFCRPMLKEDEHRALNNADTKYDVLTQI